MSARAAAFPHLLSVPLLLVACGDDVTASASASATAASTSGASTTTTSGGTPTTGAPTTGGASEGSDSDSDTAAPTTSTTIGQDIGFSYCPPDPALGAIITTSDQDFIRAEALTPAAEDLMENAELQAVSCASSAAIATVVKWMSTTSSSSLA